ncbi:hypothetical protein ARSEF1564_010059 [Beauveria bassiana]
MSERTRELERQLQQAKAREENERREKEEAKAREEEAKAREEEAKVRDENERREKENEKLKNQKTTLAEYLHNCHFDIYQKIRLAGASESSAGLATSVDGKYYPKWLRPWTDFSANHRQEHFNDIIRVCESDDKDSPSASPPQDADDCDESPAKSSYTLRPRACKDAAILPKRREDDEHGGDEGSRSRITARASNRSKDSVGKGKNDGRKGSASAPTRQYCTQACLLGLKSGHELDKNCPNVRSHNVKGGTKHLINVTSLVHLMARQLRQDPYECCHALDGLGKRGSTGVLFRLEMAPLGYTFVGKGTVKEHLSILKHECKIYQRLSGLQGEVVPVHLGIVSFARGYILTGGDRVVHMMLMSWGGLLAKEALPSYLNLKEEVRRSSHAVYKNGVDHGDERAPNQLWNAERHRVMVIDFDRAALLPEPQNKLLASLSTTGKKRKGDEARDDSGKRSLSRGLIQSVR